MPNVLLLTYPGSGSSFVGQMLQSSHGCFFLSEPLKPLLENMHHVNAYYRVQNVCSINGCRSPNVLEETTEFAIDVLQTLYNCRRNLLPVTVMDSITHSSSSPVRTNYKRCKQRVNSVTMCLQDLFNDCTTQTRCIESTTLSSEVVGKLLLEIPNLRVVHFLRDPRGIILSRIDSYQLFEQGYARSAEMLCKRIMEDVVNIKKLQQFYPGKIKNMFYEDLVEHASEETKRLFEFAGLHYTEAVSLLNKTTSFQHDGVESRDIAYGWRKSLPFTVVQLIDRNCLDLYFELGINYIVKEQQLKDPNFSTRREKHGQDEFLLPVK